jgi:hypothetical protein
MAVGSGAAAFFQNFPQGGYLTDNSYWMQNTERNDAPASPYAFTGLGGTRIDATVQNVGLLARIKLLFVGTLTVTTAVTTTYRWPWGFLSGVDFSVNGQTGLISANGLDLRAHRNRIFRNPVEQVGAAPGTDAKLNPSAGTSIAAGTYPVILPIEIPIVHDMTSLAGLLFAQSDANYFGYSLIPESFANLFSAGAATLTGTFYPELTFFDIPVAQASGNQPGGPVLPPMNWLHGFVGQDSPLTGTGDNPVSLLKESGQLLAVYYYLNNISAQLPVTTSLDQVRLEYGINRKPIVWSGPAGQGALGLLDDNQENYNGLILPGFIILDFEGDNPQRDIVYPRGVSELQFVNTITASATVNAGAKCHFVTETLYSAT